MVSSTLAPDVPRLRAPVTLISEHVCGDTITYVRAG